MGHVAARISGDRAAGSSAGSASSATSPASRFETTPASAPAAGRGQPARRDRRHALVSARRGCIPRQRGRRRRRRVPRRGRARRRFAANRTARARGSPRRTSVRVRAGFVIDASGTRGFLHRALGLAEQPLTWLPPTQALYTHFEGVRRFEETPAAGFEEQPPFPVDAAALHHVFPGGWIWVLRFANGITSAGAAVTDPLAAAVRLGEQGGMGAAARAAAVRAGAVPRCAGDPSVRAHAASRVPKRRRRRTELGAAAVGGRRHRSAALHRLSADAARHSAPGPAVRRPRAGRGRLRPAAREYERQTLARAGRHRAARRRALRRMDDFEHFKRLTLLYFAAASYSETVEAPRPE